MSTNTPTTATTATRLALVGVDNSVRVLDREEAMQAYAEGGFIGKLLTIEAAEVYLREQGVKTTGEAGTVSEIAAARVERHDKLANSWGIAQAPTVFAPGMRVVGVGHDNFRTERQDLEDMPLVLNGLREVWKTIRAEGRQDVIVDPAALRMDQDGRLRIPGGEVLLEMQGLSALCSRMPGGYFPRAAEFLASMEPEHRAAAFNAQAARVQEGGEVKLRLRSLRPGETSAYAVVSPNYTVNDVDAFAEQIGKAMKADPNLSGLRGEVRYLPGTASLRVDAIAMPDRVVDLAAGDIFKVGVRFRTNDAGKGGLNGTAIAWRNRCLNLIIIGKGQAELFRVAHKGDLSTLQAEIAGGLDTAGEFFGDFMREWGTAFVTPLPDQSIEETISAFAALREVKEALGGRQEWREEILASTFDSEPGDSIAAVINALTAVHREREVDAARVEAAELAAGILLPRLNRAPDLLKAMEAPLD